MLSEELSAQQPNDPLASGPALLPDHMLPNASATLAQRPFVIRSNNTNNKYYCDSQSGSALEQKCVD